MAFLLLQFLLLYIYIKSEIDSEMKDSEIKPHTLRLANISKDTTNFNMKKAGRREKNNFFSFDCNAIDTSNILDIHIFLMKET